jgi:paraquat-inducible protein A
LLACPECDALQQVPRKEPATYHCPRCGAVVHRAVPGRLDQALALCLAAIFCFVLANSFPIVAIEAAGDTVNSTLIGAALALQAQQMDLVAVVVVLTTVIVPSIDLFCTVALLLFARARHSSPALALLFRTREALRPWNMVEIFVLGSLVAIVKLGSLASVILGTGIWSLGAFIVLSAATSHAFDPVEFWDEIEAGR